MALYKPGESGNLSGPKIGSTSVPKRFVWRKMIEAEGDALIKHLLKCALDDEAGKYTQCLKIAIERLLPKRAGADQYDEETREILGTLKKQDNATQLEIVLDLLGRGKVTDEFAKSYTEVLGAKISHEEYQRDIKEIREQLAEIAASRNG